jgi:hypothetical protein
MWAALQTIRNASDGRPARFHTPRFRALYSAWKKDGDAILYATVSRNLATPQRGGRGGSEATFCRARISISPPWLAQRRPAPKRVKRGPTGAGAIGPRATRVLLLSRKRVQDESAMKQAYMLLVRWCLPEGATYGALCRAY